MTQTRVNCPNCQKPLIWSKQNEFRPFCCERCKLIDLGEWAAGRMVVPANAEYDDTTAADLEKD